MSVIGMSNSEIFIVDDDAAVCGSLSMLFTLDGYRVMTFGDGVSFLGVARTRPPACVLLDVHMPGKTGLDILKEVDARTYPAPILIMSGRADIPTAVEAIKGGAYDFIEKRMDGDAMVALVREAIDHWAEQRQQDGNGYGNGNSREPLSLSFSGCDRLTRRERDVLGQITAAASNKETAKTLGISRRTVEVHRVHIMQKLGAKNTADLVRIVLSNGRRG
jgi:two-component system response regulator FixJ